jgi:hypothetical protein
MRYALIAAALAALLTISSLLGFSYGKSRERNKFLEYQQTQKALEIERENKYQESLVKAQKEKENAIKDLNKRHAAVVSSLQQRTQRPTSKDQTSAPTVCTGTGSTGDRLYREDAEFLIGEAARAEVIKQALRACRQQLEAQ